MGEQNINNIFSIVYMCGSTIYVNTSVQQITSPSYPDNYANYRNCEWILEPKTQPTRIHIDKVTMPEIENREDTRLSVFENAKVLKRVFKSKMKSMIEEKRKIKALHGQYPNILDKSVVANKWRANADRICSRHEETVDHIVCGCEVLAKIEYISRHNYSAAYFHWSISKDYNIETKYKWYEHKP